MPEINLGRVVGPQGKQGIQGEPGPDGAQGVQGPPGQAATINGVNALTVTAGDNIKLKQEGSNLEIGAVVPGENLLLNGDFRRPVNRNGKMAYTNPGYTIDLWRFWDGSGITVQSGSVRLLAGTIISQIIEDSILKCINGKTVTASFLTADGTLYTGTGNYVMGELCLFLNITDPAPAQLYIAKGSYALQFYDSGKDLDLIAAKLELGDHQTLARQSEDGEWELIDPPNYDLQYALCSQYSPITGEWVGSQHSNPNLLDNWYFVGGGSQQGGGQFPINQRGQLEYPVLGYTIDRWWHNGYLNGTMAILPDGISLSPGLTLGQKFEDFAHYEGHIYTASVLTDNDLYSFTFDYSSSVELLHTVDRNCGFQFGTRINGFLFYLLTGGEEKAVAAKLELGPVQTLAHKEGDTWVLNDPPPNKALELAKCQRYQYQAIKYNGSGETAAEGIHIGVNFPCTMRATPTMQTKTGIVAQLAGAGGSGYYTDLTASFKWGSPTSCNILLTNPDTSKFIVGHPVSARIDTSLLFDANL